PHAKPDRLVSRLPSFVDARADQLFSDTTSKPLTRHVQTDQLDRLSTFDAFLRFTIMELRVTGGAPFYFREQKGRGRIFQLSRLLCDVERRGHICSQVFGSVVSGERIGKSVRSQFGEQSSVGKCAAPDR